MSIYDKSSQNVKPMFHKQPTQNYSMNKSTASLKMHNDIMPWLYYNFVYIVGNMKWTKY